MTNDNMCEYNKPLISIIMGIYKSMHKQQVIKAIDSILEQDFSSWEFIICDDGSPDDTWDFLNKRYGKEKRIKLIRNKNNGGLRVALNACLAVAKGTYIARQDADDYSRKDRLSILYKYMTSHPECDVLGSAMMSFDDDGEHGVVLPRKLFPQKIDFKHGTVVAHASTIMKKSKLLAVNGYRVAWETTRCEDTDLFMRMVANGSIIHNINDPLYYVRQDREAFGRKKYINRIKEATVKYKGFKLLKMPLWAYIYVLKPLIVGLIPRWILRSIKKRKAK